MNVVYCAVLSLRVLVQACTCTCSVALLHLSHRTHLYMYMYMYRLHMCMYRLHMYMYRLHMYMYRLGTCEVRLWKGCAVKFCRLHVRRCRWVWQEYRRQTDEDHSWGWILAEGTTRLYCKHMYIYMYELSIPMCSCMCCNDVLCWSVDRLCCVVYVPCLFSAVIGLFYIVMGAMFWNLWYFSFLYVFISVVTRGRRSQVSLK